MNLKKLLLSGVWASMTLTGCMGGSTEGTEPGTAQPGLEGSEAPAASEPFGGSTLTGEVCRTAPICT